MARLAGVVVAVCVVLVALATAAVAATTTGIGSFTLLTGTSTDYTTTMQLPATGFPEASVTSTSRSGQVGVQSGASTWFGENSPVGLEYGSSRDKPYLNLRPRADSAASPSVTTYTFDTATPQGWAFVLGDIDADQVQVSATKADGTAASVEDLGFEDAFNLCGTSPRPPGCSPGSTDVPSWDPATRTLTGNAGALDTYGAAGWFEPTASLRTLTFTFTRRSGFPVFQTWFAVKAQDVAGAVTATGDCDPVGLTFKLLEADGRVVEETQTGAGGAYAFMGVAASDGFDVEISDLPDGCIVAGPTRQSIDLTNGDDTADFAIREIIPVPISGHVRDDGGQPLAGVTVTIDGPGGPRTATTDSDGFYLFDANPVGAYTLEATPPAGYSADPDPESATVAEGDEDPITDRDFVLAALPTVSGTISGQVTDEESGLPVADVTINLDGPGGTSETVVTDEAGNYVFAGLAPGSYSIEAVSPDDRTVNDPDGREVTIPELGGDVRGIDFTLAEADAVDTSDPRADDISDADLPDTGAPTLAIPLAGLALVGAGALVLTGGRLRRRG